MQNNKDLNINLHVIISTMIHQKLDNFFNLKNTCQFFTLSVETAVFSQTKKKISDFKRTK